MTDKLSRGINVEIHEGESIIPKGSGEYSPKLYAHKESVVTPKQSEALRKASELTVEVNVDVSEALTGLKALQREAKKATQALKELETAQKEIDTREGSFLHFLSIHFGIPVSELQTKNPSEIAFLFASYRQRLAEGLFND